MAIDGLLADPARGIFVAHPAGDLLGGPARAKATLDLVAQPGIPHQLALPGPPSIRVALRNNAPVAAELRDFAVVEMIAPQLAEIVERCRPSLRAISSGLSFVRRQRSILRRSERER